MAHAQRPQRGSPEGPARPVAAAFVPLFEEGGTALGAQRKAPVSLGAAETNRKNREDVRASAGHSYKAADARHLPATVPSSSSERSISDAAHRHPAPSTAQRQQRVVQNDIDEVERRMMSDQARAAQAEQLRGNQPDVFDAEYERIVHARRVGGGEAGTTARRPCEDEFDF